MIGFHPAGLLAELRRASQEDIDLVATPYPLPESTRQSAVLLGDGSTTYGPFGDGWGIFDVDDVLVETRAVGAVSFVEAAVTIAKVNPAAAYGFFTVTFGAALSSGFEFRVTGKRLHERELAVTRGGAISGIALEKELSKVAVVLQEQRRDINATAVVVEGDAASQAEASAIAAAASAAAAAATAAAFNITVFDTRAEAIAATINAGALTIYVGGHTTAGIGGAVYKEIPDTGPLEAWQFRSNGATRRWQIAEPVITPFMLGAVGDGASNDRTAINAWLQCAALAKLALPRGTFRSTLAIGEAFTALPAGSFVEGESRETSVLEFVFNGSDTIAFFTMFSLAAGNIRFRNLKLKFVTSAGNKVLVFSLSGSKISFDGVVAEGNVTCTAGVVSANLDLFVSGSGNTCEDFSFINGRASGFEYVWLKSNISTAVNRRWHISGNHFENNWGGSVNLNSPLGITEDVWIEDNSFGDHFDGKADMFPISLASVKNSFIKGNKFTGRIDLDCIHIEEAAGRSVISGNIANYSSNSGTASNNNGISVLENNISGVMGQPSELLISQNILRRTGTGVKGTGILMVYNGTADVPARRCNIHDNYIENYINGIAGGDGFDDVRIAQNHIKSCTTGLYAYHASPRWKDNTIEDCTTGLLAEAGGAWGKTHFKGAITTYVGASPSGGQLLLGWSRVLSALAHAAGSTFVNFTLFPVGERAKGKLRVHAGRALSNTGWTTISADVAYDGTTLTAANDFKGTGAGALDFDVPGIVLTTGNLQARIFAAAGAFTDMSITADFEGAQQFP